MGKRDIVVCGSVHIDIFADSDFSFNKDGKDLPGTFAYSIGGTSFNVLMGLLENGIHPVFVSALPRKSITSMIVRDFLRDRQVEHFLYPGQDDFPEPGFLAIREKGKLKYAVTSTCVDHPLCRQWIGKQFTDLLYLIPGHYGYFDCNLHVDTIIYILNCSPEGSNLFISGVSEVKVKRFVNAVLFLKRRGIEVGSKVHSICMNNLELEAVIDSTGMENPLEFLQAIWIITYGPRGVKVYIPDKRRKKGTIQWFFPSYTVENPVSSSGCGDAFFSSYIASILKGLPLGVAINEGQNMAFKILSERGANRVNFSKCIESLYLDDLTGVFSRKFLEDEKLWISSLCKSFCVALIDGDNFKRINDVYGHQTGDEVLKVLGDMLRKSLRSSDIVIRYGGEEFLIIFLPEASVDEAFNAVERIRRKVEKNPFFCKVKFTVSAGIAKDTNIDSAIKLADKALYRSKSSGKNRVTAYKDRFVKKEDELPVHLKLE